MAKKITIYELTKDLFDMILSGYVDASDEVYIMGESELLPLTKVRLDEDNDLILEYD